MIILPLRTALFYVLAAEWLALTVTLALTADADPVLAISSNEGQIDATVCSVTAMRQRARGTAAVLGCARCSDSASCRFHTAIVMRAATPALTLTTEVYR